MRTKDRPGFDVSALPVPEECYVVWLDLMGMQALSENVPFESVASYVGKLHDACIRFVDNASIGRRSRSKVTIDFHAVLDGGYFVTNCQSTLEKFLKSVMLEVFMMFKATKEKRDRFMVRGGLSYGRVVRQRNVDKRFSSALARSETYPGLLFGLPLVRAYKAERLASPFGIYIDELAREFAPAGCRPLVSSRYEWWRNEKEREALRRQTKEYLQWAREHHLLLGYRIEEIDRHMALADSFLSKGVVDLARI